MNLDELTQSISDALAQDLVYANVSMMDEYLLGIQSVIAGEATHIEAISRSSNPSRPAKKLRSWKKERSRNQSYLCNSTMNAVSVQQE